MTISKQAILGMIEIDKAVDTLIIETTVDTYSFTGRRNTYANIIDLIWDLDDFSPIFFDMYLSNGSSEASGVGDFKTVIELKAGIGDFINITGTLAPILGVDTFVYNGNRAIALNTPLYSWIPRFRSNDGGWFKVDSESVVRGSIGVSGNLSGISTL